MIIMNIAEWIANLFILGIAGLIWVIVLFGVLLLINIVKDGIDRMIKGE
tara:strand:+ start:493 stop:639 length:147 start_codon:yes stop_codon:yes gene_type:complete